MISFTLQILSLIYILFIIIIFFSKKRIKSLENKIFISLLLLNFGALIVEIISFLFNKYHYQLLTKIFLICLVIWLVLFTVYVFVLSSKKDYLQNAAEFIDDFYPQLAIVFVATLITLVLIVLLPYDILEINDKLYLKGPLINFITIISGLIIFTWIIKVFSRRKVIISKNKYLIFGLVFIALIIYVLYLKYPYLFLITPAESLIIFLLFHTIENPDLKMINELNLAMIKLEKASKIKENFLASISHEVRTPLNAIVGLSENLIDNPNLDKDAKNDVNDIAAASFSLLDIVGNMIDLNTIDDNKVKIEKEVYNLKKEVEIIWKMLKIKYLKNSVKLNVLYEKNFPSFLFGDKVHIREIITNLLSNALKYTDSGFVLLIINYKNNNLMINVKDTGKGMKKSDLHKIFKRFERLDVPINSTKEGLGLGLVITKKLVDLMDGKINVKSSLGKGTEFMVEIPQEKIKNILIVDDNKMNIKIAKNALLSFGFNADECFDGNECLDKIKVGNNYDLILMDIMMPNKNGTETLKELKLLKEFNTPVIALTADAVLGASEKYLKEGFNDYIAKPFKREILKEKIEKALNL